MPVACAIENIWYARATNGMGTSISLAISRPNPTSFGIHDLRGLYLRLAMISMMRSIATESCWEFFNIVRNVSSVKPPFLSQEQISAKVKCVTAANIAMAFLTNFALPSSPTYRTLLPMALNTGWCASNTGFDPESQRDRVPAAAASSTPPAEPSRIVQPFFDNSALTLTIVFLSMLLKSIQSLAPFEASCKPPVPNPTVRTASLYGSIDTTTSDASATSLGDALKSAPWFSSPLACSRRKSLTTSLFPALIKFAAIPLPMPPVPMNPKVFISPPEQGQSRIRTPAGHNTKTRVSPIARGVCADRGGKKTASPVSYSPLSSTILPLSTK